MVVKALYENASSGIFLAFHDSMDIVFLTYPVPS